MACNAECELVEKSFSHRENPSEGGSHVGHGKSLKHPSHHISALVRLQSIHTLTVFTLNTSEGREEESVFS